MSLKSQVAAEIKKLFGDAPTKQASQKAGIDRSYVHKITHEERNLSLDTVDKIAAKFGREAVIYFPAKQDTEK